VRRIIFRLLTSAATENLFHLSHCQSCRLGVKVDSSASGYEPTRPTIGTKARSFRVAIPERKPAIINIACG
jgi:hypothetical protein